MSSLTDIIFLLLIFFMLTSTLVRIKPFDLPKSDSKTVAATSVVITIERDGNHSINNREISRAALERAIRAELAKAEHRENFTVTIVAETGTPFTYVMNVMDMANRMRAKAIIATEPREG